MASSVILFPGQGSQFIGMAKKVMGIPIVSRMFELANSVFKRDLLSLCLAGPQNELDKTINCQAAIYVTSLAAVEKLKLENIKVLEKCKSTAGFSVGEYASLVLSGVITYEDGLKILKARSEIMQKQSECVSSGLLTVFTSHDSQLQKAIVASKEWCSAKLRLQVPVHCRISNFLYPDCKVVGGNVEALEFIEINYKEFKLKRVKRVPVSGAFHTELMKSETQLQSFRNLLSNIKFEKPLISVYSNVTGKIYENERFIKSLLVHQIYKPVLWEQILHKIYEKKKDVDEEYPETFECGPGTQLGTILKQVNNKAFQNYKNIEV